MKKVTVFEIRGQHDCEGRGPSHLVGFCETYDLAYKMALGKGAMGTPGEITECFGYLVEINNEYKFVRESDLHKLATETHEEVVARAKAKLEKALSAEELKALGLK